MLIYLIERIDEGQMRKAKWLRLDLKIGRLVKSFEVDNQNLPQNATKLEPFLISLILMQFSEHTQDYNYDKVV